jgi:hypothetical protein
MLSHMPLQDKRVEDKLIQKRKRRRGRDEEME